MKAYTDYPILALGDISGKEAPIRKVEKIIDNGDDVWCQAIVDGIIFDVKKCYIYKNPGRAGEVPRYFGLDGKPSKETKLFLTVCDKDNKSIGNTHLFTVNERIKRIKKDCDNFPGFLYGQGDGQIIDFFIDHDTKWVLIECKDDEFDFNPYACNIKDGVVTYIGDRKTDTDLLKEKYKTKIVGHIDVVGDKSKITTGDLGMVIAGNNSEAFGGFASFVVSGHDSKSKGGDFSFVVSGEGGKSTTGHNGIAISSTSGEVFGGNESVGFVEESGEIRLGRQSHGFGKDYAEVSVDEKAVAYAGVGGKVKGKKGSTLILEYRDLQGFTRIKVGYVGEDLEPDVFYKLDNYGYFIKA